MSTEYDGLDPIEPDDALRLYLDHKRSEYSKNTVQSHRYDQYGRKPLFSSVNGRLARGSIRRNVYIVTAPCFRNEQCEGCTNSNDETCPGAVSPHAVRRGSIAHFLGEDVSVGIVGDRMDVSRTVLMKPSDQRSDEVKLEQRRGYLENV